MIRTITPPESYKATKVFLAGGITGCPDWQAEITEYFTKRLDKASTEVVLLNPRRPDFPINDPNASYDQIRWEHKALREADIILFWFPCETMCPIVLYELGAWSMTDKPLVIGCHPEYSRKRDVEIQTGLVRLGEITIVDNLKLLAEKAMYEVRVLNREN